MAAPLHSIPFDYEVDDEPLTAHEELARQSFESSIQGVRLGGTLVMVLGGLAVLLSAIMLYASTRNLLQVGPGERWTALAGIGLIAVGGLVVVALGLLIRSLAAFLEK